MKEKLLVALLQEILMQKEDLLVTLDIIEEQNPKYLQNPLEGFCWALIRLSQLDSLMPITNHWSQSVSLSKSKSWSWPSFWFWSMSRYWLGSGSQSKLGSRPISRSGSQLASVSGSKSKAKLTSRVRSKS